MGAETLLVRTLRADVPDAAGPGPHTFQRSGLRGGVASRRTLRPLLPPAGPAPTQNLALQCFGPQQNLDSWARGEGEAYPSFGARARSWGPPPPPSVWASCCRARLSPLGAGPSAADTAGCSDRSQHRVPLFHPQEELAGLSGQAPGLVALRWDAHTSAP